MRRLLAYAHGEPEQVLAVAEVADDPPPGDGQVQLAVEAVGLNFLDVMLCRGDYPQRPEPPFTPGVEVTGRVVAAGAGAEALLGHDVIACPTLPGGALGETVTVGAELATRRPAELPAVAAVGLPVTYQTAWFALARAGLVASETVLVHAAAGGVGVAITQLAIACGARVICVAGGPAKTAICRDQGAELVVDYQQGDFAEAVQAATGGRGADIVVDPIGGYVLARSLDCLAFEGRLVAVGAPPAVDPMRLVAQNATLIGLSWGSAYPWQRPDEVAQAYQELFALHRVGAIRPPVSRVVSLEEAPVALADLAACRITGKVVVRVAARAANGRRPAALGNGRR